MNASREPPAALLLLGTKHWDACCGKLTPPPCSLHLGTTGPSRACMCRLPTTTAPAIISQSSSTLIPLGELPAATTVLTVSTKRLGSPACTAGWSVQQLQGRCCYMTSRKKQAAARYQVPARKAPTFIQKQSHTSTASRATNSLLGRLSGGSAAAPATLICPAASTSTHRSGQECTRLPAAPALHPHPLHNLPQ
jgi:hypothetical protein